MNSFVTSKIRGMRVLLLTATVCAAMARAAAGSGIDESQFTAIFNGKDLSGWVGDTNVYWVPGPGILQCGGREGVACPMPATTPEEIIALAHRTYEYVARSVPEAELTALKNELAIDEKWYADAKKANDAREMRNATRELRSVRRRILFKHPDLQFKRLLAV